MKRKKCELFPPFLEKKHFYWTDFFETKIHATPQSIQVVPQKSDLHTPPFMVISERLTKLQTDRKTIKRVWNLQDTTYPFDYKDNLLSFLPQIKTTYSL